MPIHGEWEREYTNCIKKEGKKVDSESRRNISSIFGNTKISQKKERELAICRLPQSLVKILTIISVLFPNCLHTQR